MEEKKLTKIEYEHKLKCLLNLTATKNDVIRII